MAKYSRVGLTAFVFPLFFVILTYTEIINFKYDRYKQPTTAGVKLFDYVRRAMPYNFSDRSSPNNDWRCCVAAIIPMVSSFTEF